jgi:hypothetical protein
MMMGQIDQNDQNDEQNQNGELAQNGMAASGTKSGPQVVPDTASTLALDDPALADVLRDFRMSVHAWSDAAYTAPRQAFIPAAPRAAQPRPALRRSLAWALGVVLAAGSVSGGFYGRHYRDMVLQRAQQAQKRELDRQRALTNQHAREAQAGETDDLLAKVDSDISREVPTAMEPLAQMMADDGTQ